MPDPKLNQVSVMLCDLCMDGKGGECHTPGCLFWMLDAPGEVLRGRIADQDPGATIRQMSNEELVEALAGVAVRCDRYNRTTKDVEDLATITTVLLDRLGR